MFPRLLSAVLALAVAASISAQEPKLPDVKTFDKLVRGVAGVQVREHEDVGSAAKKTVLPQLPIRDTRVDCRIYLHLAINQQSRTRLPRDL